MPCLQPNRGRFQLKLMSKLWKKLARSTNLLHKFITNKSKKVVVVIKLPSGKKSNDGAPLYFSPRRRSNLKKKLHKNYKVSQEPPSPIYVDSLYKNGACTTTTTTTANNTSLPSMMFSSPINDTSLPSIMFSSPINDTSLPSTPARPRAEDDEHINESSDHEGSTTSPASDIDERAAQFISRIRRELRESRLEALVASTRLVSGRS